MLSVRAGGRCRGAKPSGVGARAPIDWDELLSAALRVGLGVDEFWSLTPRELSLVMEARMWQAEQTRKLAVQQAWLTAVLERSKRVPPLKRLLGDDKARPLRGKELERRRAEHEAIVAHMGKTRKVKRHD